jgi:feruloyl esterase
MRTTFLAASLFCGAVATPAWAQSAGDFAAASQSPVPYTQATVLPQAACASLQQGLPADTTVTSATPVAATGGTPAFCRVLGIVAPEIRFEVDLPAAWNRRFYMFGNGGYAGEDLAAPTRQALSANAMKAGFLTAQTNTGHDARTEPLATFATASYARTVDYAFRAVHETVLTAKRLADRYYGRPVAYSYWDSCSTGGREGLMSVQRFPADFDGVIAGAPVRNFVDTMVNYVWNKHALDGVGLTLEKIKAVAAATLARCDKLGEGMLSNPTSCDFSPARDVRQCRVEEDAGDCLTAPQAEAIQKVYDGIKLPDGSRYFFGWAKGAEITGQSFDGSGHEVSLWQDWILAQPFASARQFVYMTTFMQNMAFGQPMPAFDDRGFDFAKDPARMGAIRALLVPDEVDLSPFRRHGGKLIMYHGWADMALTPYMSIDYYERATAANGPGTPDFFRLFMVPGMSHCRGGVATDHFDAMTSIVNWVEHGTAPDTIAASRWRDGKVDRTRPLCPYPQAAAYKGAGSIDDAGSFVCR